ncbi:MAG: BMP family protein [Gallicola sp.]|nr:BMP family protein [Gallicola sp.]
MKKIFKVLFFMFLIIGTVSCGTQKTGEEGTAPSPEAEQKEETQEEISIEILIPGNKEDNGFMEAAYRGYEKIKADLNNVEVNYISDVSATSEEEVLTSAMRELAEKNPDLIIAQGGQNNKPAEVVSKEFPEVNFIVIQGNVKGENLGSYAVDQEQSAYLAGVLAGYMSNSGKVGHLSGAWPQPGVNARAAFYNGLISVRPNAEFYSTFTGNLDDLEINKYAASRQLEQGVDVIYTMLNGGRAGATEAIKEKAADTYEIGNVIDWTKEDDVFIGSAVADSSIAIFNAAKDFREGKLKLNETTLVGLENEEVVNITMSDRVPQETKDKVLEVKNKIISGEIKISTEYSGKEFDPNTGDFVDQDYKENYK